MARMPFHTTFVTQTPGLSISHEGGNLVFRSCTPATLISLLRLRRNILSILSSYLRIVGIPKKLARILEL
jgi:hypothetical protein